jgi:hypothetical protein
MSVMLPTVTQHVTCRNTHAGAVKLCHEQNTIFLCSLCNWTDLMLATINP